MKKLLLALTFTAIAPFSAFAQSPTPEQMGEFLAGEMCADYLETGEFFGDDGYEKMAGKLIAEYGSESALLLLELAPKFSRPPQELLDDPYLFPMAQSLVSNMAKDDQCFRMFLAEEVFKEESEDAAAEPNMDTQQIPTTN
ncbi:hypothetical protein Lepto7376_0603 [[Leptolyngbya] sp. PCC 7376]|uniref:hypothetical protein n=1 Tax=[Leptolyngbya] sp. PCC 7376 TaxID=111781 RepID=UPI00029F0527|nr:hypothetical protein [[Leptolyngbya] sp. PCC 7376]AFY37018.1 hypothetical protein Lepto7376_0603 [[Leptolyngbya] sp. PCC 7376]